MQTTPEDCSTIRIHRRRMASQALNAAWPSLSYSGYQQRGPPQRILHLGCGNGDVTSAVLAPRFPETVEIIATDPDPAMADAFHRHENPGIFYTPLDIARPNRRTKLWELRPFSKIFSFDYLQSLSAESVPINVVYELLAPGGEAVLSMTKFSSLYTTYRMLSAEGRYKRYMQDVGNYVPFYQLRAEYNVHVSNLFYLGFHLLTSTIDNSSLLFHSEKELVDYLLAIDPFIRRLPEEDRENYIQELLCLCKGLCGVTIEDCGHHRLHFSQLTVVVRKI